MDPHEHAGRILEEVGTHLGIALRLDDEGICRLRYDGALECTLEVPPDDPALRLYCPVVALPAGAREPLLEAALERNLFGVTTRGCALAFDRGGQQILLCGSWPLRGLDAVGLQNLLSSFLESAGELHAELTRVVQDSPVQDGSPTGVTDTLASLDGEDLNEMLRYMRHTRG